MLLDVLLVLDDHLAAMELPGARHIYLTEGQGLCDVGLMAVDQQLLFVRVRVLVLLTGFAEVEAEHPAIINSVLAAFDRMQRNVGYRKIVVAAPVPRPYASATQLKATFKFTKILQHICKQSVCLEFTKSGSLFYGPGGFYANLLDNTGLTSHGVETLHRQLLDKLNSLGFANVK